MAIGRISGQMLKANLLRSGVDLAFETNLLVLDVTNSFVGIGTSTPSRQLHLSGTGALRLPSGTDEQRGTSANGDIRYNTDQGYIEGYSNGTWKNLTDQGIDNVVEDSTPQLGGDLDVQAQSITTSVTNGNVTISPNGTGAVVMSKVDIGGGEIDGTTIGANSAAAGTFTTVDTSGNVTVGGNLTVNGVTTTIESTTLTIEDPLIVLAKNNSGGAANTYDQGLLINRGSETNQAFIFDESEDQFAVIATTETGSTAGNIVVSSYAGLRAGILRASTELRTGTIKADDGSAAITIADNTGEITASTNFNANAGLDIAADNQSLRIGLGNDLSFVHTGTDSNIFNNTGNLTIDGAIGSKIIINQSGEDVDFVVEGDDDAELFFVNAAADKIGISTASPEYILDIATTDAIRLPNGNTAARPSPATGVIRFNTQLGVYEGSTDGSTWSSFAMGGAQVAINKVSTTGDGSTSTFAGFFSATPASANNVMVFIDNVYQEPTENYTISGNNITFTSAPHSGARIFAIEGFDNTSVATGGVARSLTESVSFTSAATTIMDFNAASYRSAELYIQITDAANTEYSCMKAHVIHDGTDAYITVYGAVNTSGSDTATLSVTLASNTVSVQAISTGGQSSAIVQYSLAAV